MAKKSSPSRTTGGRELSRDEVLHRLRQITADTRIVSSERGKDTSVLEAISGIVDGLALKPEEEKSILDVEAMKRWASPSFSVLERLTLPARTGQPGVEPLAFPTAGTVAVAVAVVVAFRPGAATQDELRRGLLDRLNDDERAALADQLLALRNDPKMMERLLGNKASNIVELTKGNLEVTAKMLKNFRSATG